MVTAEDFNQIENKKIMSYDELLQQITVSHKETIWRAPDV
jgi:hypothetical protein